MTDLLTKFKKLKISNQEDERIKLKRGTRIKIINPGNYKGQIGYFHCLVNDHGYCIMDTFPLKKVRIKIERIQII